ncbi:MAG: ubiquinone/menaquinone biosynthesis methyltransferase [Anaerolineales bacterium]|jgi:demethylmenaquinone methyltransferase/2-methoxy-6-polyprenyl-1,4-benzoquinol methylase
MSHLTGKERSRHVREMFERIAPRYDLMNGVMTLGQDMRWRREAIRRLQVRPGTVVLDVGAGTGDIAFEIARKHPDTLVVAFDFTLNMIRVGKERQGGEGVVWVVADAQQLPFGKESVSGVISGFLLRNVPDIGRTLKEHARVLRPGGRAVSLDTTPPRRNLLRPFLEFYLHRVVPFMGRLLAGDTEAYTYLPNSTEGFLPAEALAERFREAGMEKVGFVRRMFGVIGIHWCEKS